MLDQILATTILLFIIDDVGPEDLKGPTFDHLRNNGVEFTRAYSQPWCAPTRDSLFRSRWDGAGNGGICNGVQDTRFPTLPKLFQGYGVTTTLIGKAHLGSSDWPVEWPMVPNMMGFDHWLVGQPVAQPPCSPVWPGVGWVVNDGVIEQDVRHHTIREEQAAISAEPGLVVVSFKDAHSPWEPAPYSTATGTTERELYEAEIASLDVAVSNVLASYPNAWVVVLGDNGTPAAVDTDNLRGSKHSLYEGGIRVPLIMYGPGLQPMQVDSPVSVVDIAPTIVDALGWVIPEWMEGQSLLPVLSGCPLSRPWSASYHKQTSSWAIVEEDWKLIVRKNSEELYRLSFDPTESTQLPTQGAAYDRLKGVYRGLQ